jgi:hypothetical protein
MLVRINGLAYSTVGNVFAPDKGSSDDSGGFIDWLNSVADGFVNAEVSTILKPIWYTIKQVLGSLVSALNVHSVEIITLGVVYCSIGMMVAPLMGSTSARWFGRVVFVMLVGSIWRLLII